MNTISTFNFKTNQIRTQIISNNPWFCLKDCCDALSLKQGRTNRLNPKGLTNCHTLTNGGKQDIIYINEPNLYRLIFRSNKPQAQEFANWVYEEVLPTIRKTGAYTSQPTLPVEDTQTRIQAILESQPALPAEKKC